jgi:hypothetical protein
MKTDEKVRLPFQAVGREYGFEEVQAEFYPFKEFKTTWQRCGNKAEFKVTDYLLGAKEDILGDFASCLFTRIQKRRKEVYTDRLLQWLQSPEFVQLNQPLYLERSRNLTFSPQGDSHDLLALLDRLHDKGLVHNGKEAFISWTDRPNRYRMGYCSILMKVVAISSALDSQNVPDFVTEYVLYHEMLHLENGTDSLRSYHDAAFRRQERLFPQWKEAEAWLKRVANRTVS